ncbi:transmembrane emp24 domain-containing protein eca-like [Drosophila teissieri]|uniref:transmembrane emp24 domain-containing protein eca-like n=1 Tax=Drosophila teissieri TaxID=7243 RepID=UPI001CB9E748|nr:transmembrane emp24 domain-containing protein eca-like [Drosophila teissieri]
MERTLIVLVLLLGTLAHACGLYFTMRETVQKCFIQTTPDETDVLVHYAFEVEDSSSGGFMPAPPGLGMHVEVRDSMDKVVLSRVYKSEALLKFTTHWPGDHRICLQSNSSAWFEGALLRVHLDIETGERTVNYEHVRRLYNLDYMQLRILQLMNQAKDISRNQNYQRFEEQRYRTTCDSIYFNIVCFSVAQVVILLLLWAIQYHLLFRKPSLYLAYCQILCESELSKLRTPEAFRALITIVGPNVQGLTSKAFTKWIRQLKDPDSTYEQLLMTDEVKAKVEEFVEKFLCKPAPQIPETVKGNFYSSNVQLSKLLSSAQRNRSVHLKGDHTFLVCDCEDCKAEKSNTADTQS